MRVKTRRGTKKVVIKQVKKIFQILFYVICAIILLFGLAILGIRLIGVPMPYVVITTKSMMHDYDFDTWWVSGNPEFKTIIPENASREKYFSSHGEFYTSINISKEEFKSFRFRNGINPRDLLLLGPLDNIRAGDVITFYTYYNNSNKTVLITHRVVSLVNLNGSIYYQTRGDKGIPQYDPKTGRWYDYYDFHQPPFMRNSSLNLNTLLRKEEIIGKPFLRIPFIGGFISALLRTR